MHRCVNQSRIGMALLQAALSNLAAVRRSVVHDPEDTVGRSVGFLGHDLIDQSHEWLDSRVFFAATENQTTTDVPRRQVLQCPAAPIFELNSRGRAGLGRQAGMDSEPGLN